MSLSSKKRKYIKKTKKVITYLFLTYLLAKNRFNLSMLKVAQKKRKPFDFLSNLLIAECYYSTALYNYSFFLHKKR